MNKLNRNLAPANKARLSESRSYSQKIYREIEKAKKLEESLGSIADWLDQSDFPPPRLKNEGEGWRAKNSGHWSSIQVSRILKANQSSLESFF